MTLYQNSIVLSNTTIKNMTNAAASQAALDAIAKAANAANVASVTLVVTSESDNATIFSVWGPDDEHIFNVDNDGIVF